MAPLRRQAVALFSPGRIKNLFELLRSSAGRAHHAAEHLRLAIEWLCRAQQATGTGGVSYGYGLLEGWWPPYPETTGYCIPTFLRYARLTGKEGFRERARAMAKWELSVQNKDGGIAGGPQRQSRNNPSMAFDTGQVLHGLIEIYRETKEQEFLCAAERAGRWLVGNQGADGSWQEQLPGASAAPHAYNARTSWALLELYDLAPRDEYKQAAQRNLEWTLRCQLPNGWFCENAFVPGQPALTHTIAYVLEGLVESWRHLRDERLLEAALKGAFALRDQFDRRGWLPAAFDSNWGSKDWFSCVTGCAQTALVWLELFEITRRYEFREAALRMNGWLKSVQICAAPAPDILGGLPGSAPFYGAYERMRLPNWGAKFFADAMLRECEQMRSSEIAF